MSTDTYILITGSFFEKELEIVLKNAGYAIDNFIQKDLNEISIGVKHPDYCVWTLNDHQIDRLKIETLIKEFKAYSFSEDDNAIMTISDDTNEDLSGIYIHPSSLGNLK